MQQCTIACHRHYGKCHKQCGLGEGEAVEHTVVQQPYRAEDGDDRLPAKPKPSCDRYLMLAGRRAAARLAQPRIAFNLHELYVIGLVVREEYSAKDCSYDGQQERCGNVGISLVCAQPEPKCSGAEQAC